MNIYFLGQKGFPAHGGGVERHVDELATRLAKSSQNEVFVYARKKYSYADSAKVNGVNVLYTPAIYTKHLEAISHVFFSILDLIRRDVDIIHIHSIGPSLLIPFAKLLKPQAKVISTIHCADYYHQKWGAFARFMLRAGERIACKFSDLAITVSKNLQQYLWHAYHAEAEYIPNGVTLPELNNSAEPLTQWGLKPQEYIVSISRLVRHKGIHYLIEAYKQLDTDKKLVIVGGSEYTDDYVKELKKRAAGNPNIIFTGKQSGKNLTALFEHAYIFVQPSQSEGLSVALLEALSYNLAVLSSDIPENLEIIEKKGITFKQADITDLAKKLSFMLDHPEIIKQYKQGGREYVNEYYNWDKITKSTQEVYKKAHKKKKKEKLKQLKIA